MSALTTLNDLGVHAQIEPPDQLRLRGLSKLTPDQKEQIIKYAQSYKPAIIAALSQDGAPGQCESCPAAGYYDFAGGGLQCFFTAYYLHKTGQPEPCAHIRATCPRKDR